MKKYRVRWDREVRMTCSVCIEAESEQEALVKWEDGEFEMSDYYEEEDMELERTRPEIKEIK